MQTLKKALHHGDSDRSPSGFFSSTDDDTNVAHKHHKHEQASAAPHTSPAAEPSSGATMTTPAVESTALEGTTRATSVPSGLTEYTRGSDAPTEPARTVEGSTERRQFTQFALPPTSALAPGHEYESHARLDAEGAKHAIHDSKMLSPVLHERHLVHETEEVVRKREIERHIHHVQAHVQPVKDIEHLSEKHHDRLIPITEVQEKHVSTPTDKDVLVRQFAAERDLREDLPKEHVIVDKGEQVIEREIHHVHHIVRPVIEREVHEHERVHTTIPTHHVVNEAPIVHQRVLHQLMDLKDFLKGGGVINSTMTPESAGVLVEGPKCFRNVNGPAAEILSKLKIPSEHERSDPTWSPDHSHNVVKSSTNHA